MGPKAASDRDKLQFVLCLQSIKEPNGLPAAPRYEELGILLNLKPNSVYVKYRDIVNKEVAADVPFLTPVGTKANTANSSTTASGIASLGRKQSVSTRTKTGYPSKNIKSTTKRKHRRSNEESDKVEDKNGDDIEDDDREGNALSRRQRTSNPSGPLRWLGNSSLDTKNMDSTFDQSSDLDAEGDYDFEI